MEEGDKLRASGIIGNIGPNVEVPPPEFLIDMD